MTPAQTFELALGHHRAGRTAEAESLYRSLIERDPEHHQALYLLSVLSLEAGRVEPALELVRRASKLVPANAVYLTNLGEIERRLGRLEEASETLFRAVALQPDLVQASFNLGLTLREKGELGGAIVCLERAADLKPELFVVQHALAQALEANGELARAVGHYHAALALDPKSAEAQEDLAWVLRQLRRLDGALVAARRAVALAPDSVAAELSLGAILLDRHELDEAKAVLERVVARSPSFHRGHFFLGNALREAGEVEKALESYRRAIAITPTDDKIASNLVYTESFAPGLTDADILKEARAWATRHATPLSTGWRRHENERKAERRLRIGYVSPDFCDHCQALFTLPLFRNHDRRAFEIVCYSSVERPDAVTNEIQATVDEWREVAALDDEAAANLIRNDGIDILVDLTMHMANTRLLVFARKPAPVQVSWLAYPGTTGVGAIDYRITDRFLDPEGENDDVYSEKSIRLPDTFWCYDPRITGLEPGPLPAAAGERFTFGCLNAFSKIHEGVLELFARVLRAVPSSELVLLVPPGETRKRVLATFAREKVAGERITFASRKSRAEYLKSYNAIDLCLDTFPYNGHTTSLDAFWMGVPVVTLVGDTVVGRAGLCQAMNLGLPELVAKTPDEYVNRAVGLASDRKRLGELRAGLRARMQASPLMDGKRFAANLEGAYRSIWRRYCES